MTAPDSDLTPARVLPRLTTARLGRDFHFLPACGSTNDEAAARAAAGAPEGLVIVADTQSGGRGRRGRSWHSPAGENLYCSVLLRPALPARQVAPLTLLVGAAVARALAQLGFVPRLKWPNDVLLETPGGLRKVAGILTEMASEGGRVRHVVVGLGININGVEFPAALAQVATSLRQAGGKPVDRTSVLAGFLAAFELLYGGLLDAGPAAGLAAWSRHAVLGQRCWIERSGQRIEGTAARVDGEGALVLHTTAGENVSVHAGEVNWR